MAESLEPYKFDYTPVDTDVHAALGKLLVTWNNTEEAARRLLGGFCGGTGLIAVLRAEIVTRELGSRGLVQSLQAFAHDVLEGEASAAVLHCVNWFERLLEYRNYYTHGIVTTMAVKETGPCGFIQSRTAKGTLAQHTEAVPVRQISEVTTWCAELSAYINKLSNHLFWDPSISPFGTRPSLPEMPPLPDKLEKRRQFLRQLRR